MLGPVIKKLKIELDGNWVLKHRDDEVLPIDAIKAELSKDKTLALRDCTLTSITVIYCENTADYSGLKACVARLFKSRYHDTPLKAVASFCDSYYSEEVREYMLGVSCFTIDDYNDKLLMLSKGKLPLSEFLPKN